MTVSWKISTSKCSDAILNPLTYSQEELKTILIRVWRWPDKHLTFRKRRYNKNQSRTIIQKKVPLEDNYVWNKNQGCQILLAGPHLIKKWAQKQLFRHSSPIQKFRSNQVLCQDTFDYKTFKPYDKGLFCQKLFGTLSNIPNKRDMLSRRHSLAYCQLPIPVMHIWYLKGTVCHLSRLLKIKRLSLERQIYTKGATITSSHGFLDLDIYNIKHLVKKVQSPILNVSNLKSENHPYIGYHFSNSWDLNTNKFNAGLITKFKKGVTYQDQDQYVSAFGHNYINWDPNNLNKWQSCNLEQKNISEITLKSPNNVQKQTYWPCDDQNQTAMMCYDPVDRDWYYNNPGDYLGQRVFYQPQAMTTKQLQEIESNTSVSQNYIYGLMTINTAWTDFYKKHQWAQSLLPLNTKQWQQWAMYVHFLGVNQGTNLGPVVNENSLADSTTGLCFPRHKWSRIKVMTSTINLFYHNIGQKAVAGAKFKNTIYNGHKGDFQTLTSKCFDSIYGPTVGQMSNEPYKKKTSVWSWHTHCSDFDPILSQDDWWYQSRYIMQMPRPSRKVNDFLKSNVRQEFGRVQKCLATLLGVYSPTRTGWNLVRHALIPRWRPKRKRVHVGLCNNPVGYYLMKTQMPWTEDPYFRYKFISQSALYRTEAIHTQLLGSERCHQMKVFRRNYTRDPWGQRKAPLEQRFGQKQCWQQLFGPYVLKTQFVGRSTEVREILWPRIQARLIQDPQVTQRTLNPLIRRLSDHGKMFMLQQIYQLQEEFLPHLNVPEEYVEDRGPSIWECVQYWNFDFWCYLLLDNQRTFSFLQATNTVSWMSYRRILTSQPMTKQIMQKLKRKRNRQRKTLGSMLQVTKGKPMTQFKIKLTKQPLVSLLYGGFKVKPKLKSKVKPILQPKVKPKLQPKVKPKLKLKVKPKLKPKVQLKVNTKVKPKVQLKVKRKTKKELEREENQKLFKQDTLLFIAEKFKKGLLRDRNTLLDRTLWMTQWRRAILNRNKKSLIKMYKALKLPDLILYNLSRIRGNQKREKRNLKLVKQGLRPNKARAKLKRVRKKKVRKITNLTGLIETLRNTNEYRSLWRKPRTRKRKWFTKDLGQKATLGTFVNPKENIYSLLVQSRNQNSKELGSGTKRCIDIQSWTTSKKGDPNKCHGVDTNRQVLKPDPLEISWTKLNKAKVSRISYTKLSKVIDRLLVVKKTVIYLQKLHCEQDWSESKIVPDTVNSAWLRRLGLLTSKRNLPLIKWFILKAASRNLSTLLTKFGCYFLNNLMTTKLAINCHGLRLQNKTQKCHHIPLLDPVPYKYHSVIKWTVCSMLHKHAMLHQIKQHSKALVFSYWTNRSFGPINAPDLISKKQTKILHEIIAVFLYRFHGQLTLPWTPKTNNCYNAFDNYWCQSILEQKSLSGWDSTLLWYYDNYKNPFVVQPCPMGVLNNKFVGHCDIPIHIELLNNNSAVPCLLVPEGTRERVSVLRSFNAIKPEAVCRIWTDHSCAPWSVTSDLWRDNHPTLVPLRLSQTQFYRQHKSIFLDQFKLFIERYPKFICNKAGVWPQLTIVRNTKVFNLVQNFITMPCDIRSTAPRGYTERSFSPVLSNIGPQSIVLQCTGLNQPNYRHDSQLVQPVLGPYKRYSIQLQHEVTYWNMRLKTTIPTLDEVFLYKQNILPPENEVAHLYAGVRSKKRTNKEKYKPFRVPLSEIEVTTVINEDYDDDEDDDDENPRFFIDFDFLNWHNYDAQNSSNINATKEYESICGQLRHAYQKLWDPLKLKQKAFLRDFHLLRSEVIEHEWEDSEDDWEDSEDDWEHIEDNWEDIEDIQNQTIDGCYDETELELAILDTDFLYWKNCQHYIYRYTKGRLRRSILTELFYKYYGNKANILPPISSDSLSGLIFKSKFIDVTLGCNVDGYGSLKHKVMQKQALRQQYPVIEATESKEFVSNLQPDQTALPYLVSYLKPKPTLLTSFFKYIIDRDLLVYYVNGCFSIVNVSKLNNDHKPSCPELEVSLTPLDKRFEKFDDYYGVDLYQHCDQYEVEPLSPDVLDLMSMIVKVFTFRYGQEYMDKSTASHIVNKMEPWTTDSDQKIDLVHVKESQTEVNLGIGVKQLQLEVNEQVTILTSIKSLGYSRVMRRHSGSVGWNFPTLQLVNWSKHQFLTNYFSFLAAKADYRVYPTEERDYYFQAVIKMKRRLSHAFSKRAIACRQLRMIENFDDDLVDPSWLFMTRCPILPPDLRPMIVEPYSQTISSDLNKLYAQVIQKSNQLHSLLDYKMGLFDWDRYNDDIGYNTGLEVSYDRMVPVQKRSHKRLDYYRYPGLSYRLDSVSGASWLQCLSYTKLQYSMDRLLQNGRGLRPALTGVTNPRPLKSLSDILKGKKGRFRNNLLGKRVDYSGRSVIVVGPKLQLHQCGLPWEMAIVLFEPFILRELLKLDLASIGKGKRLIKMRAPIIVDLLKQLLQCRPILLNRAPTLHRLGIQAFQGQLISGRAILLHPLVCGGFNADFDGDQMAVHIPLGDLACAESWSLMWSQNHILSVATGDVVPVPSQDMVLGCYNLTTLDITGRSKILMNYIRPQPTTVSTGHLWDSQTFTNLNDIDLICQTCVVPKQTIIWLYSTLFECQNKVQETLELTIDMYGQTMTYHPEYKTYTYQYRSSNYIKTTMGKAIINNHFNTILGSAPLRTQGTA